MSPGFLVVDKPVGPTSHDIVAILRSVMGIKKVGHTGTLDPFATGVLPLAIGRCTRLIPFLDEGEKTYRATVTLGTQTDTGDPTGAVIQTAPVPALDEAEVREVLTGFVGTRMQSPPRYSAVKIDGKAAYKYAREGKAVKTRPKEIRIYAMTLLGLGEDTLDVEIRCGRGTYVRVIAEEIGVSLGTVAHASALRRTRSGPFVLDQAMGLDDLSQVVANRPDWRPVLRPRRDEERVSWIDKEEVRVQIRPRMLSATQVLGHLDTQLLTAEEAGRLKRGGVVPGMDTVRTEGTHWMASHGDQLVAVLKQEGGRTRVARMFAID